MTSAVFEAHVREMQRIKALAALQMADVVMLPHISNSSRRDWFRGITKLLMPKFNTHNVVSFNGKILKSARQMKRAFKTMIGSDSVDVA